MGQLSITELPTPQGFHKLLRADGPSGLRAYISLHNIKRGPGLGGCRLMNYDSDEKAIEDALNLSRAMTYKNAAANLPFGGGKAVITTADPSDDMLREFGTFVEALGGDYITTEDMNMSIARLEKVRETTGYVVGFHQGKYAQGDPAHYTGIGVVAAIETTLEHRYGSGGPKDRRIVVVGVGAVGGKVAAALTQKGAKVSIADVRRDALEKLSQETGAQIVPVEDALFVEADLLCPCARGDLFHAESIARLRTGAVCGAANNQLRSLEDGDLLDKAGILYAPDYIANSGGVIGVGWEAMKSELSKAEREDSVQAVSKNLREIFGMAEEMEISPARAADLYAENRFLN